ncbi:potassium channel family protein [Nonomuraea sp. LPB2021202275-12-8]|uniref:potassium channel family protein n=1 Tax=Nonomuraea sp. LPB2021202275-12-8 TaxID=3120159 RepID=UPI00300D8AFB
MLGLGRFGGSLALHLAMEDGNVLGVDKDPEVVRSLADSLDRLVVADTTDLEVLRRLGVAGFRQVVVAIGQDVAASVLTTSLLAELEIQEIWARAATPRHARILERVGAHRVVLPQQRMGELLAREMSGRSPRRQDNV